MSQSHGLSAERLIKALHTFRAAKAEITVSEVITLLRLSTSNENDAIDPSSVAEELAAPLNTVSQMLARLEMGKQGQGGAKLIEVSIDLMDRRKRRLELTAKGRALVRSATGG